MLILGYSMMSYLLIGIFNRSFAVTDKEFLIINSHFPFGGVQSIGFEEISEVKISSDWKLVFPMIIVLWRSSNYVQIKTKHHQKKYYCLFLDVDCHDENWTERTLDDLYGSLKQKGVNVELEI